MKKIDKTLAEQLQISDREIAKRKALLNFTDRDVQVLRSNKELIDKYIDGIVNQFYDHQTAIPEIALVIGDAETLRRLRSAMRNYILELFEGFYDAEYVNRRLRIGKIHERIGVSPKLYISAIYLLQKVLKDSFAIHFDDRMHEQNAQSLFDALNKILMFDIQLVFDTYIASLVSEIETAKEELEGYAQGLEEEVAERTAQLRDLASRDELTGLFNQRGLYENLHRELASVGRYKEILSFVYLDLNGFKMINDTEGHKAGDKLLAQIGKLLQENIREIDIACRYGGDEFCILMPRTQLADARKVVERVIHSYKKLDKTKVSFSVGITSTGPDPVCDIDSLIRTADALMYQAKEWSREKPGFQICMDEEQPERWEPKTA